MLEFWFFFLPIWRNEKFTFTTVLFFTSFYGFYDQYWWKGHLSGGGFLVDATFQSIRVKAEAKQQLCLAWRLTDQYFDNTTYVAVHNWQELNWWHKLSTLFVLIFFANVYCGEAKSSKFIKSHKKNSTLLKHTTSSLVNSALLVSFVKKVKVMCIIVDNDDKFSAFLCEIYFCELLFSVLPIKYDISCTPYGHFCWTFISFLCRSK